MCQLMGRGEIVQVFVNILCTSKPCDGLLFYSYEYCSYLNSLNIKSRLIIVGHRDFNNQDYLSTISSKYIHCENIVFDNFIPDKNDVTLIMGRSMMTLPFQDIRSYSATQLKTLKLLFSNKLISVYNNNHPANYLMAVEYFTPSRVVDLCDTEVYPNGVGQHFEKKIYFEIYKEPKEEINFEFLFLGTNKRYYQTVEKYLWLYPDHGILTYNSDYINSKNNNVIVPINNLLGKFETFVYTKDTFDPAPRIIQECKHFGKKLIYSRDPELKDGGSVYWKRDIEKIDASAILEAVNQLNRPKWVNNIYSRIGLQL